MRKKMTTEEFIAKAREVHGDKYDYSKVNYINNSTKVIIICPIHGEFEQTDCHMSHAMIWMVKDILSHRPHVPKSKAERKAIRQKQAKYHIRIPKIA